MANTNVPKVAKVSRKGAGVNIEKKLDEVFADLKKELGETKFKNRIKKAAKILSKGLDKKKEKAGVVKVPKKKAAKVAAPKPKKAAVPKKAK